MTQRLEGSPRQGPAPAATALFAPALAEPEEAAPLQAEAKAGLATSPWAWAHEVGGTQGTAVRVPSGEQGGGRDLPHVPFLWVSSCPSQGSRAHYVGLHGVASALGPSGGAATQPDPCACPTEMAFQRSHRLNLLRLVVLLLVALAGIKFLFRDR